MSWQDLARIYVAATAFILVGFTINSDALDRLEWGWRAVVLLIMFGVCQTAHWLFEDTYRRKYQSPPKHVLVKVKSEHGDIERIITPRQNEAYAIQIYDKTINIELKEDKK